MLQDTYYNSYYSALLITWLTWVSQELRLGKCWWLLLFSEGWKPVLRSQPLYLNKAAQSWARLHLLDASSPGPDLVHHTSIHYVIVNLIIVYKLRYYSIYLKFVHWLIWNIYKSWRKPTFMFSRVQFPLMTIQLCVPSSVLPEAFSRPMKVPQELVTRPSLAQKTAAWFTRKGLSRMTSRKLNMGQLGGLETGSMYVQHVQGI